MLTNAYHLDTTEYVEAARTAFKAFIQKTGIAEELEAVGLYDDAFEGFTDVHFPLYYVAGREHEARFDHLAYGEEVIPSDGQAPTYDEQWVLDDTVRSSSIGHTWFRLYGEVRVELCVDMALPMPPEGILWGVTGNIS